MGKLIGDKKFYKTVLAITIPVLIQNFITNFVNMLDNVMVGTIGNAEMTGVAVANQLITIYNLCIFGAIAGAGIFGAQFFGKKDIKNFQYSMWFRIYFGLIITVVCIAVLLIFGKPLTQIYLNGEGSAKEAELSLGYSLEYIKIMVIGFVPYCLSQSLSSTLRETGKTVLPMTAGLIAVFVNLVLNYVLIFGHFGAPRLGVRGAAIATVISRFAEVAFLLVSMYINRFKQTFVRGIWKSLLIPMPLVKDIFKKGLPLMINETFWSTGMALLNQVYSVRGIDVVSANNIYYTFSMLFSVAFISVGSCIAIIVGQQLGAGKTKEAKQSAMWLIVMTCAVSAVFAVLFAVSANFIPLIYNTTDAVRLMATRFMIIAAIFMPFDAVAFATYFTIRSGGSVIITMIFDCGFVCLVNLPVAFVLAHYTGISIYWLFAIIHSLNIVKSALSLVLVAKGKWIKNLTE